MTILEIAFVMDRNSLRSLTSLPGHLNGKKVVHHPYSTIAFKDDIQTRHIISLGKTMRIDCKDIVTSKDATVLLFDPLPESMVSPQYMVLMTAPGVSVDNYKLDLCNMESLVPMKFTLSGKIGARVAREGQNPEWVFDLDELRSRDDFFNLGIDFGHVGSIGRIVNTLITPNTPIAEMELSPGSDVAGIADADAARATADTIVRRELASFQPASDFSIATEYMRAARRSLEILRQHEACEQFEQRDPQEPYRLHDEIQDIVYRAEAPGAVSVSVPNGLPDIPIGYPASPQACGPSTDGDCEIDDAGCCDECSSSCESCESCDGSGS